MAHWLVELEGSQQDLKFLATFLTSPEFGVVWEDEAALLRVVELADHTEPASVLDATTCLVESLNGATKLFNPRFEGVASHKAHRIGDDGSRSSFGFLTVPPRDYRLHAFRSGDTTLEDWMLLSRNDPFVAKAFTLYGALEHDWMALYMVLEVVKDDLGGWGAIATKGFLSSARLRDFKQTATASRRLARARGTRLRQLRHPPAQ